MGIIDQKFKSIESSLISIERNTINGWYELQIGIPNSWVYNSNELIECKELHVTERGVIIKVSPLTETVIVDDLFDFVSLLIETNGKIAEKEKEFEAKMNELKTHLENEAKKFYEELDAMKSNSFDSLKKNEKSDDNKTVTKPTPKTKKQKSTISSDGTGTTV